jgi:uncharacterized membrane protein
MTSPTGAVTKPRAERNPATGSDLGTRAARRRSGTRGGSTWRVPLALVALTIFPVVAGSLRLLEIAGGPHLLPDNPRIDAFPAPVVVHIVAVTLYALFGAFQFSAWLRGRRPNWHRRSGRMLIAAGMTVAVSGLWLTLFYPDAPGGDLLWAVRLLVGSAVGVSIILGFTAIRRRDIPAHRAWMIRAYALAVGAGTQTLTQGIGEALFGTSALSIALSMTSGWAINATIAEWVIRRRGARRARTRPASARSS